MTDPQIEHEPGAATVPPNPAPQLDVQGRPVRYVNFCRVTGTPEEVILDLGMQTPEGASHQDWQAPQRVTLDFYTAKRLVLALGATLAQFEATFGRIEVDVERRLASGGRHTAGQQPLPPGATAP